MIRRYGIEVREQPLDPLPDDIETAFKDFGFGECMGFLPGLSRVFRIAREAGFLPESMFEIFDTLMYEETRHIVFFINWMACRQVQQGPGRPGGARPPRSASTAARSAASSARPAAAPRRTTARISPRRRRACPSRASPSAASWKTATPRTRRMGIDGQGVAPPRLPAKACQTRTPQPASVVARGGGPAVKRLTLAVALAGILLGTALVGYFGFDEVGHALFAVGWLGFFAIVAYHLAGIAFLGLCWYVLAPRSASISVFIWGRLIRDSGSEVLPLSQLGGYVMGARAVILLGLPGALAVASTIVDVTLEVLGQLGYTAIGLAILARLRPETPLIGGTAIGIAVGLAAVMGFIAVQRRGSGLVERGALAYGAALETRRNSDGALDPRRARRHLSPPRRDHPGGAAASCRLGRQQPRGLVRAPPDGRRSRHRRGDRDREPALRNPQCRLRGSPMRSGYRRAPISCWAPPFGLTPEVALALSLLKRARDTVASLPALLAWQVLEGRRLLTAPTTPGAMPGMKM